MRKILLSTAMMTGALVGADADAQPTGMSMAPTQGQTMTTTAGNPPAGANNNNNSAAAARKGGVAVPEPGTVVIHFNGRVLTGVTGTWSSLDKVGVAGGGVAPPAAGTAPGAFKVDSLGIRTYARLYTGLDAMTTNSIRYGGAIEVRSNFGQPTSSSSSTGASGYTSTETFYLRRAFAYAATEKAGIIRIGQADGLISLYDNGVTTFQFLPSGVLNGGDLQANSPSGSRPSYVNMGLAGDEYGNAKITYLSPQFMGVDLGFQWAPNNTSNNAVGAGGCTAAASGCPQLSSSTVALDGSRIVNQTAFGARYQGTLGPVNVLAYGVYMFGGHVNYNGPPITYAASRAANSSAGTGQFEDLSIGNIGAAITISGVTFGGNWIFGDSNGAGALKPVGGAKLSGLIGGVKYTQGPITVGAAAEWIDSQGAVQLTGVSQRKEFAIDIGASYTIAPGLVGWVEGIYQTKHQGAFNFATNSSAISPGAYNDTNSKGFMLGTTVYW